MENKYWIDAQYKQLICDRLLATLQLTRRYGDLQSLLYMCEGKDRESVLAIFTHESIKINVTMDSGAEMILDILKAMP